MTTTSVIRRARAVDLGDVVALLDTAGLPLDGLGACDIWVAVEDEAVVGVVGFETHGDVGLVRSLAVLPDLQGSGMGATLVLHVLDAARHAGLRAAYALTTTASGFLTNRGFARIDRSEVPPELSASPELSGVCGPEADLFVVDLT